ncbi:Uncharacterized protein Adt_32884 [Abeliophyllum distichum]|uniref:Uncharacterized protein n=1 Tax=Abeliophyllum distichum TaxID=126358 RepID=A0ABD1QWP5_9LAMI
MARCRCCWSEYAMKALHVSHELSVGPTWARPYEGHYSTQLANMSVEGMSSRIVLWGMQITLNTSDGDREAPIDRVCFEKTVCCGHAGKLAKLGSTELENIDEDVHCE